MTGDVATRAERPGRRRSTPHGAHHADDRDRPTGTGDASGVHIVEPDRPSFDELATVI